MKKISKIYNEYAKTYNLKEKDIMLKFHHSYRVMEFAVNIAKSLELSEEDIHVVATAGLFHDIARFKQWTEYKTYKDSKSFDHGDVGYEILKQELIDKLTSDKEKQELILKSVKNHNKLKVEEKLNKKELLITNIIRDADKLDIMTEQGIITKNEKVKDEIIEVLFNHKMVDNNLVENEMDLLFRLIAFIFDLNFKYSYQYILNKKIIENKINLIENYGNINLKELENNLIKYIKERL